MEKYGAGEGGHEVVLTFDDGPHPRHTPELLDYLSREQLKAVFFVCGERVAKQGGREIVARAHQEGHLIGNHTYTHPDLRKLSIDQIRDEIRRTHELIAEYEPPHRLFRPPYGAHNPVIDGILKELDYNIVLRSVDPEDWRAANQPAQWIDSAAEQISRRTHSTFLCHDIHATTVANFPAFINRVRALPGAQFVTYA